MPSGMKDEVASVFVQHRAACHRLSGPRKRGADVAVVGVKCPARQHGNVREPLGALWAIVAVRVEGVHEQLDALAAPLELRQ